jgi:hypothetical protein
MTAISSSKASSQLDHDPNADHALRHFNQVALSRRWNLSPRTLERWRWLNQGPPYLKIGGRVVYRLDDIEAFEAAQMHRGKPLDTERRSVA